MRSYFFFSLIYIQQLSLVQAFQLAGKSLGYLKSLSNIVISIK